MAKTAPFDGFPEEGLRFLSELRDNNRREWFEERKKVFRQSVQEPAQQFIYSMGQRLVEIAPGLRYDTRLNGSGSLFRIYRDTRFSADKTPYKTNLGIVIWNGEGKKTERPGYYFHLDPREGLKAMTGWYRFPKQAFEPWRQAVDDEKRGGRLRKILDGLSSLDEVIHIGGEHYKRVPRGFDKDHPRADLLKYHGIWVETKFFPLEDLLDSDLIDACFERCEKLLPLHQWLVTLADEVDVQA